MSHLEHFVGFALLGRDIVSGTSMRFITNAILSVCVCGWGGIDIVISTSSRLDFIFARYNEV